MMGDAIVIVITDLSKHRTHTAMNKAQVDMDSGDSDVST